MAIAGYAWPETVTEHADTDVVTGAGTLDFDDVDTADTNDTLTIRAWINSTPAATDATGTDGSNTDALAVSNSGTAGATTIAGSAAVPIAGTYGTFNITRNDATGELSWTYTLDVDKDETEAISEGKIRYEVVTILVTDDETTPAASAFQTITVKITGTNDRPVFRASRSNRAHDDTAIDNSFIDHSGNFHNDVDDVDNGDVVRMTYDVAATGGTHHNSSSIDGFNNRIEHEYFTLHYKSVDAGAGAKGAYRIVYKADAINALKTTPANSVTTVTITADDGSGAANATQTSTFTITISGANDTPEISAITAVSREETTGDDNPADVTGTFSATDRDSTDSVAQGTLTFSVAGEVLLTDPENNRVNRALASRTRQPAIIWAPCILMRIAATINLFSTIKSSKT